MVDSLDRNGGISPEYLRKNAEQKFIYLVLKTKMQPEDDFTKSYVTSKCREYEQMYNDGFKRTRAYLDHSSDYDFKFLNITPYPYRSTFTSLAISLQQTKFLYWVVAALPFACLNGVL